MSIFGKRRHNDARIVISGRRLNHLKIGDVWIDDNGQRRWLVNDTGWTRIGIEEYRWWRHLILIARRWGGAT